MENDQLLLSIERKLDVLVKLVALNITKEKKLAEGAPLLSSCGLDNESIAKIYGTTADSVRSRLAEAKKTNNRKGI